MQQGKARSEGQRGREKGHVLPGWVPNDFSTKNIELPRKARIVSMF